MRIWPGQHIALYGKRPPRSSNRSIEKTLVCVWILSTSPWCFGQTPSPRMVVSPTETRSSKPPCSNSSGNVPKTNFSISSYPTVKSWILLTPSPISGTTHLSNPATFGPMKQDLSLSKQTTGLICPWRRSPRRSLQT